MGREINRRNFMQLACGTVAAGALAQRAAYAQEALVTRQRRPIRLGGPVFDAPQDPDKLAVAHRKLGYRAAYAPNVALDDGGRIRALREAFARHDIVIAEVGRWCNLMDPDPAKRKANLAAVTEGLALAEALDARCCVDIAGSFNPEVWYGPHPKNLSKDHFDAAIENARKIIDAVKPKHARFCYEMMGWAYPDSPDSARDMIRAVDREAFGAHLDVCNLVNCPSRFYSNAALIDECFDKLGPWIVSCHAKDLKWVPEMNVHFVEVPAGTGEMDYRPHLIRLAELGRDVPLMLEHCANSDEYDTARKNLLTLGATLGVSFDGDPKSGG
jgi:sugar phosphate isomerase/epimerase